MKLQLIVAGAAVLVMGSVLAVDGQAPGGAPFRIERLDPALDDIIAADAPLETLGDRFALTEGPVWVPDGAGYLLFSDNAANVIYKWVRNGSRCRCLPRDAADSPAPTTPASARRRSPAACRSC